MKTKLPPNPLARLKRWRQARDAAARRENWCLKTLLALKGVWFIPLLLLSVLPAGSDPVAMVRIWWGYPPEEVNEVTFYVASAPSLSQAPETWEVLAVVNGATNVSASVVPGKKFFIVSASNLWGQVFSPTTGTPANPRSATGPNIARQ